MGILCYTLLFVLASMKTMRLAFAGRYSIFLQNDDDNSLPQEYCHALGACYL